MTPQNIRTKHAAQGTVAVILITASYACGAVYVIISEITNQPRAFVLIALTATLLFSSGVIVGSLKR